MGGLSRLARKPERAPPEEVDDRLLLLPLLLLLFVDAGEGVGDDSVDTGAGRDSPNRPDGERLLLPSDDACGEGVGEEPLGADVGADTDALTGDGDERPRPNRPPERGELLPAASELPPWLEAPGVGTAAAGELSGAEAEALSGDDDERPPPNRPPPDRGELLDATELAPALEAPGVGTAAGEPSGAVAPGDERPAPNRPPGRDPLLPASELPPELEPPCDGTGDDTAAAPPSGANTSGDDASGALLPPPSLPLLGWLPPCATVTGAGCGLGCC